MRDKNMVTHEEGKRIVEAMQTKGRYNKYRAKRTIVDGINFASKHEAKCYIAIKMQKAAGTIKDFKMQVKYDITINHMHVCFYIADFVVEHNDGKIAVLDAKGMKTDVYKLKKKLMLAANNILITEV